ncbi:MAG: 3-hydroxyacyl-ACP dehydratase FabZ [Helicobacter sp.]|nr:3-hydroxyacyl-ACP dehydratase FabZ [Helicobacter sp.]MDE7216869.1 3-hydroxyacyl-ACP dehydratase FabZ [Helicobacter sp.]MDE7255867.1 3-hydroxyacyl-ACP dehydratase FabZ [Helicobacter sp.]
MDFDIRKIRDILPHRFPLLLVDRVVAMQADKDIHAYKNITINEEIFCGHFPTQPIYPGVFIIEGLAQAGGILAFTSMFGIDTTSDGKIVYFMSIDKAKFRNPVIPGDRLDYRLNVLKHKGSIWLLEGKAFVGEKLVAEAELMAKIIDNKEQS